MCRLCLPRRSLLLAAAALPVAARAAGGGAIEPHMRLARPAGLTVALTLDACPGGFDQRIAAALVALQVPATIFVTGLWMQHNAPAVAFLLAHADLFDLQNHGARHVPPVLGISTIYGIPVAGDLPTIRHEIAGGATAITTASGQTPRWYRAATGYYSPQAMPAIQQLGFGIGAYSLNADQGASLPAGTVASRIASARDGDVIVAHVNQPLRPSGAGVAAGVKALQQRGATFVRLDRLESSDVVYAEPGMAAIA